MSKLTEYITKDVFNKRNTFEVTHPNGKLLLGKRTYVMGILNVTPDSFYDGSKYNRLDKAVKYAVKMVQDGADIIDVGGESTRPGAYPVSENEETKRVIPIIKILSKYIHKPIAIDTYKSGVAIRAIDAGASIINDIGGLQYDRLMVKVASEAKVPVIIMHKKGKTRTMQKYSGYKNLLKEIISYFRKSITIATSAGVKKNRIIIDPGIGFGKTRKHNLKILQKLQEFQCLGFPILIGTSRKRFIGDILKAPVHERLYGTLATIAVAVMNGAHIVRVHDVRETVHVIKICDAIRNC